jgi:hypothetical protein
MTAFLLAALLQACPRDTGVQFRVNEIVAAPATPVPGKQLPYIIRGSEDFVSPRRFEVVLYPQDFEGIEAGDVVILVVVRKRD